MPAADVSMRACLSARYGAGTEIDACSAYRADAPFYAARPLFRPLRETARRLVRLFFAFRIILLVNRALICYNRPEGIPFGKSGGAIRKRGKRQWHFWQQSPRWAGTRGTISDRGRSTRPSCGKRPTRWWSQGFRDAGYVYVSVDDCWMAVERDANGDLQADPVKFPSGMKALGDYIHERRAEIRAVRRRQAC